MTGIRIAVLTDIHAAPAGNPPAAWHDAFEPAQGAALARAAVAELGKHDFDVAFVLGDIANHGDDASLDEALAELTELSAPTWLVSGNHDLRGGEDSLRRAIDRASGSLQIPDLPGDGTADEFIVAGLRYEGTRDDVVALLKKPVTRDWNDRPVLLLTHYPIISRVSESAASGWKYAGDAKGLDGIADLLASRSAPTISFHGHLHLGDAVARGSYLQLGFPALIESGHQIALVDIEHDDDDVTRVEITPIATSGDSRTPAAIGAPPATWTFSNGQWRS
jgi:3',5'-cyclic AMP phosphodiesterase CpdA